MYNDRQYSLLRYSLNAVEKTVPLLCCNISQIKQVRTVFCVSIFQHYKSRYISLDNSVSSIYIFIITGVIIF